MHDVRELYTGLTHVLRTAGFVLLHMLPQVVSAYHFVTWRRRKERQQHCSGEVSPGS